jgi:hypothetical protein
VAQAASHGEIIGAFSIHPTLSQAPLRRGLSREPYVEPAGLNAILTTVNCRSISAGPEWFGR